MAEEQFDFMDLANKAGVLGNIFRGAEYASEVFRAVRQGEIRKGQLETDIAQLHADLLDLQSARQEAQTNLETIVREGKQKAREEMNAYAQGLKDQLGGLEESITAKARELDTLEKQIFRKQSEMDTQLGNLQAQAEKAESRLEKAQKALEELRLKL